MAQTDFWSPVLNALITRQRMIESNQRQENAQKELEQQEKRIEQENRRIDQFEKQNERLLKQQEDAQKMRRLEAGIQLRGLADVLRGRWTGTLESPPTEAIPGADRVQQAPLMENILQSRGLVRNLPRSEVMVRGQEDKPISTSIPDFETGQPLLNIPIGTLRELSQQRDLIERNRTQEQRRQAEAAGQMELLKSRARAEGKLPADLLLEQAKAERANSLEERRIQARAEEGRKNREAAYQRALLVSKRMGASNAEDLASSAELVELGIRDLNDFSIKERPQITAILKDRDSNPPSKVAQGVIERMGQFPVMRDQFDAVLDSFKGTESSVGAAVSGTGKRIMHNFIPDETFTQIDEMATGLAAVTKAIKGESGNPSNADIERARNLLPDPRLTKEANERRRKLFKDSFESAANIGLSSVSVKQRQAIFDDRGLPFTAKDFSAATDKPQLSADGKVVTYRGKKYPIGESFERGGKKVQWIIKNGIPVPVEVK